MARKVKCPECGAMNDKEVTVSISNRYYCESCAEHKKTESEHYKEDWNELFTYICELHGIKTLTGMMFKQIKDYKSEPYNYTLKGMTLTLKYYYETLEHEVIDGTGIGIIQYYYEEAKNNFIDIMNLNEKVDGFENKEKVVKIKLKNKKVLKNGTRTIDLKSIEWSEDDFE